MTSFANDVIKESITASQQPSDIEADNNNSNDDNNNGDDYSPTTVVIMLGSAMHFEHAGNADVLSLKVSTPEEKMETLENAKSMIKPDTLESIHIILKSSSISSLFDEHILSTFYDYLIEDGNGEVMIHVLPESSSAAEDMPVQAGDGDSIRMGLVMAGLRLEMEQSQDGSWILLAKKPSIITEEENENEDNDNEGEE